MRCLLYIILLLVVTGCSYSSSTYTNGLDEAERILRSDPTAALEKLNGFDVTEFQDSASMARWALLYSEALVANRLTAPTDTIVNIAIDYYAGHNLKEKSQHASRLKALMRSSGSENALASALYLQKEKEFLLYKERAKRELYTLISVIILLLAIGIILWMRQRMKLQSARNDAMIAEASGLKCQIDEARGNVDRLETKLHGLLENRFTLIDSLCQTYYETRGTKTERKAIIDKVKAEIESVRTDYFSDMEQAVNDCRDNILVKIKESNPGIKPDDYMLLVFIASGLSTRTISLLLGESVDVIYKRKSRLKSRLKESTEAINADVMAIF